MGKSDSQ